MLLIRLTVGFLLSSNVRQMTSMLSTAFQYMPGLAKKCCDKFSKKLSNTIPATIALIITWTATGLWHGMEPAGLI